MDTFKATRLMLQAAAFLEMDAIGFRDPSYITDRTRESREKLAKINESLAKALKDCVSANKKGN